MAYVTQPEVQTRLRDDFIQYPDDIDEHVEFAEAVIDGELGGHYTVPFDDVANYAEIPIQIKWIAAYLVGYSIWDSKTSLEGIDQPDRGDEWHELAMAWLTRIKEGMSSLTLADGTIVAAASEPSAPRFYPSGVREKAASDKNIPFFTRAQSGEW